MRIILGALYCLLFTFLAGRVHKDFMGKEIFNVNEVLFYGDSNLTKAELKILGQSIYGKNIFHLDVDRIKDKIKEDIRIKDIELNSLEIGKIVIKIEEKKPKYYINIDEKYYSSDEKGKIFAYMEEHPVKNLPIIFLKNEKELPKIIEIIDKIEDEQLYHLISQIYYNSDIEVKFFIGKGTILKTNSEVPSFKYRIAKELYGNLIQVQDVDYIDLRFDGYIVKNTGVDKSGKPQ